MSLNAIIKSDLNSFGKRYGTLSFAIFLMLTIITSFIFSLLFIYQFPDFFNKNSYDIIVSKIPFGYGNLLNNLFVNESYHNSEVFFLTTDTEQINKFEINFVLKKLPLFTLVLFSILCISKNIFFLVTFKNIIFFSLFYFSLYFSLKSLKAKTYQFILILSLFFIVPYNLKTFAEISYADSVSSILLACLFLILISNLKHKFFISGVILFSLYLTKESMFILCIFIPFLVIKLNYVKYKLKTLIPLFCVVLSIVIWGSFGLIKTGKFPFGQSISTWKSYDMAKSFHVDFKQYYPKLTTDNLDSILIEKEIYNEWEFYSYYQNKNYQKLKSDKDIIFRNIILKLKFIIFNLKPDGISYKKVLDLNFLFILTNLFNKVAICASVFICFYLFIKKKQKKFNDEFYFLAIILLNLSTHLVGWMTTKHMVGISLVSFIFLATKFSFFLEMFGKRYK